MSYEGVWGLIACVPYISTTLVLIVVVGVLNPRQFLAANSRGHSISTAARAQRHRVYYSLGTFGRAILRVNMYYCMWMYTEDILYRNISMFVCVEPSLFFQALGSAHVVLFPRGYIELYNFRIALFYSFFPSRKTSFLYCRWLHVLVSKWKE